MSLFGDFFFRCIYDMDPEYCHSYEWDPESRGFAKGLADCPSCIHREPINAETIKAEREWEEERARPLW